MDGLRRCGLQQLPSSMPGVHHARLPDFEERAQARLAHLRRAGFCPGISGFPSLAAAS